jgi:hypothetical protein
LSFGAVRAAWAAGDADERPRPLQTAYLLVPGSNVSAGSLDVYVQKDSPGRDKEANWLPAAAADLQHHDAYFLAETAMLDGSWTQPAVKRVN